MGWEIFTRTSKTVKGVGTTSATVQGDDLGDFDKAIRNISSTVRSSRDGLVAILRSAAPSKTGALRRGIVASPAAEATAVPGKIVYDIYMDEGMNDTFVKYSRAGKRYYYPASQEFGFDIARRSALTPKQAAAYSAKPRRTRVPGKFFMNDTFIDYIPAFEKDAEMLIEKVVSK